jgi:hypothetical protein
MSKAASLPNPETMACPTRPAKMEKTATAASPNAKGPHNSRRGFPALEVGYRNFLFILKGFKHQFCSVLLTFASGS